MYSSLYNNPKSSMAFYVMGFCIKQELPRPAPRISPLSSQSRLPLRFSDSRVEFFCSNLTKKPDRLIYVKQINMEYLIYMYIVVIRELQNCRIIIHVFCCIKLNYHFLSEYCFQRKISPIHVCTSILEYSYILLFILLNICVYCNMTKIQYTE